ncbi:MAG: hypothetical protein ACXVZ4_01335, partial [Gaiellaceae bacterium]
AVLAGATCAQDDLPGWGWFPQSDARDFVVPPLARKLPFLLGDTKAPAAPAGLTVSPTGGATLTWQSNREVDLAGYAVYRATSAGGPWKPISILAPVRPYFLDPAPPAGAVYVVRALDTSGNVSPPSAAASVPAA